MAAVDELGYRPSVVARSLRMRRTRTFGLIVTDIQNPFFPELVQAADDAARVAGYSILLGSAAYDEQRAMHYLALMVDRRVDGLIVASSQISSAGWKWLADSPVPVVVVNAEPSGSSVPVITSDNLAGSRLAVDHLVALGHRRIGYIRGPQAFTAATPRLEGFQLACSQAGLDPSDTPIVGGEGDAESGRRAAVELLGHRPRVTAIACYNDLTAIGASRTIREAGLRIPGDVSVVGFDDIAAAAWVCPPLTTVAQRKAEMGRLAVDALAQALEEPGSQRPAEVIRLMPRLVVRESSAPPPAAGPAAGRSAGAAPAG